MRDVFDRDGRKLEIGDLVLVGMRVGDPTGWTLERVAEYEGEPRLADPTTGVFMGWPLNTSLMVLMPPEREALWRLSKCGTNCPHDGGRCHHKCAKYKSGCYREANGMRLTNPFGISEE